VVVINRGDPLRAPRKQELYLAIVTAAGRMWIPGEYVTNRVKSDNLYATYKRTSTNEGNSYVVRFSRKV